jgi:uncharacterized DUF497 family protein
MEILWDEPKRLANLDKHGMDFAALDERFFAEARVGPARDGRLMAVGQLDGVVTVVFVTLGTEALSVISMRPASSRERSSL